MAESDRYSAQRVTLKDNKGCMGIFETSEIYCGISCHRQWPTTFVSLQRSALLMWRSTTTSRNTFLMQPCSSQHCRALRSRISKQNQTIAHYHPEGFGARKAAFNTCPSSPEQVLSASGWDLTASHPVLDEMTIPTAPEGHCSEILPALTVNCHRSKCILVLRTSPPTSLHLPHVYCGCKLS